MDYFFFIAFGGFALFFIIRFITKGGIKGFIFGSKIMRTIGEIPLTEGKLSKQILKVHILENGKVGLEFTSKAPLAYNMMGYDFDHQQLNQLIGILQIAKN